MFAHVFKSEVDAAFCILLNARRDANAARLGQAFEAGSDVDAIAKDLAVLDDDLAHIDADAQIDALVRRQWSVAFGHCSLDLSRATQGVDNAGELDQ